MFVEWSGLIIKTNFRASEEIGSSFSSSSASSCFRIYNPQAFTGFLFFLPFLYSIDPSFPQPSLFSFLLYGCFSFLFQPWIFLSSNFMILPAIGSWFINCTKCSFIFLFSPSTNFSQGITETLRIRSSHLWWILLWMTLKNTLSRWIRLVILYSSHVLALFLFAVDNLFESFILLNYYCFKHRVWDARSASRPSQVLFRPYIFVWHFSVHL